MRLRHLPGPGMAPRDHLEADRTGRRGETRGGLRLHPAREYLHGRRQWTEERHERLRKLLRPRARLDPAHAVDGKNLPVRRRCLIARVKMAHIAEQAREGDQVAQALVGQLLRTLGGGRHHGRSRRQAIADPLRASKRNDRRACGHESCKQKTSPGDACVESRLRLPDAHVSLLILVPANVWSPPSATLEKPPSARCDGRHIIALLPPPQPSETGWRGGPDRGSEKRPRRRPFWSNMRACRESSPSRPSSIGCA